jgi:uncharacterized protein YcfJ
MKKTLIVLAVVAGAAGAANAEEFARVVSSAPVMQQVAVPRQVCTQQQVATAPAKSGLGAILGGVAGAALGNQIGRGGGREVATAAGAIGGAVLGNNMEDAGPGQVQTVQTCHTETVYEQRVNGYTVQYEYAGRQYTTQLPYQPGPSIRVRVSVTPVI